MHLFFIEILNYTNQNNFQEIILWSHLPKFTLNEIQMSHTECAIKPAMVVSVLVCLTSVLRRLCVLSTRLKLIMMLHNYVETGQFVSFFVHD